MDMRIYIRVDEAVTYLSLEGEVDLVSAAELVAAGETALTHDCRVLRINLADVTFMDSTGLGALIKIRNTALPRPVVLENPQSSVRRILDITGLAQMFSLEPSQLPII